MLPTGLGWLIFASGLGFTVALAPQLIRTIRLGRANDLSVPFIAIVIASSIMALLYFVILDVTEWFVYYGYIANAVVWSIVLWYRLFPRTAETKSS